MFWVTDKFVAGMAAIRIISGLIEFSAALLMLKFNKVESALKINAVLALIGPTVLTLVTAIGIAGLAGKLPWGKIFTILLGVALIFWGVRR